MRSILISTLALTLASPALAEDNSTFCARMAAEDKLEGRSASDCKCVYGQADNHLTPEMKKTIQESHDAGTSGEDMMRAMFALGLDHNDIFARMEAYAGGIDANCKIQ